MRERANTIRIEMNGNTLDGSLTVSNQECPTASPGFGAGCETDGAAVGLKGQSDRRLIIFRGFLFRMKGLAYVFKKLI